MIKMELTEDWILEDLAAITGKDIKELRKSKSKSKSTPVNRHKYFRRPGKRHNNDFCFSCHEGGTLICCDGCTKSFHLLCLDPPMEDEDIPEGEWLCKTCILANKSSDGVTELKFFSRKRRKCLDGDESEDAKESTLIRSVWTRLIKRALECDPKEYENPLDCRTIPYIFPGDSKNSKKSQIKLKHPHSTQCYICGKGLSKQSMVNCDYCERSFHLDCTDPPLTIPPKYFWMCQFHLEPCLERLFYQEEMPSLSQRIAVWDMCRKPIDHEAVKLEFLRNAVTDKSKLVQLPTVPIDIPDAVVNHYNNRPDMIPSLKEALRLVGYDQSVEFLSKAPSICKDNLTTKLNVTDGKLKEEQELWLATILGFQKDLISKLNEETVKKFFNNKKEFFTAQLDERKLEIAENEIEVKEESLHSSDASSVKSKGSTCGEQVKIKKPHEEITKVLEAAVAELPEVDDCLNIMNYLDDDFTNILAFQRLSQLITRNKLQKQIALEKTIYGNSNYSYHRTNSLTNPQLEQFVGIELESTQRNEESQKAVDETVTISDGELYKTIAKQDFAKIIGADPENNKERELESIKLEDTQVINTKVCISSKDQSTDPAIHDGINMNNPDNRILDDSKSVNPDDAAEVDNKAGNHNEALIKTSFVSPHGGMCGESKILGVLTTVAKQTELFPVYKSGFVIGRGKNVHLDLDKCGHCNFISNHHAVIYIDDRTKLWELINYSRFGSRVNNTLLSFDVPKKALNKILDSDSDDEICSFHQSIKEVSRKHLEVLDGKVRVKEQESWLTQFYSSPCDCNPKQMYSNMSSSGWNNSAPFGHGSLLQFGCIRLVFGDISYVTS